MSQQPDIVPIIATGVIYTSGKFRTGITTLVKLVAKFATGVFDTCGAP
jgi:hypothetical protein